MKEIEKKEFKMSYRGNDILLLLMQSSTCTHCVGKWHRYIYTEECVYHTIQEVLKESRGENY